ncbi:hypothetical protein M8J77_019204 [Diaphorina citri]|nr:hypothetical protein M8J77_019204 [Diaphorina citri]
MCEYCDKKVCPNERWAEMSLKIEKKVKLLLRKLKKFFNVFSSFYTFVAFVGAVGLLPFALVLYLVTTLCRYLWHTSLRRKYPELEFVTQVTLRTAMDTIRNQGIVTVMLQVNGAHHYETVKQQVLRDIVDKRKRNGRRLCFPHLKCSLTSRRGCYAWVRDTSGFNIDNHVILESNQFRGRPVTEANVKEYISDIVFRNILHENYPPWQIILVPLTSNQYYIIVRLHHLYISEDKLGLSDLIMMNEDHNQWIMADENIDNMDVDNVQNILSNIFRTPVAIPELYEHICETCTNYWNEIISTYDPIKNKRIVKSKQNLKTFCILLFITTVTVIKNYNSNKSSHTQQDIFKIIRKEIYKRNINYELFKISLINTVNPVNIIDCLFKWIWFIVIKIILQLPIIILHIIRDTPIYIYWFVLLVHVCRELVYLSKLIYQSPKVLIEEMSLPNLADSHYLQTISLSGRKIVTWSEPIHLDVIKSIREHTGAATCEIQLYATGAALRDFFKHTKNEVPETVLSTCRFIPQESVLHCTNHPSSGLLCLALPTNISYEAPLEALHTTQWMLFNALNKQTALYLGSLSQLDYGILTKLFPSIVVRIFLYILSRRYPVTITQIETNNKEANKRKLFGGHEVQSLVYWRPPQANICLSLSLMSYNDEIRLGVMADAQLCPHHLTLAKDFVHYVEKLSEAAKQSHNTTPLLS